MIEPVDTSLQAELSQLRSRVSELEHELVAANEREQALRESETRLRFIVDGSDDGAWDWNMTTNETFLSPRWFELLGYEPNELPNNAETWMSRLHPDEAPHVMQCLQDYITGRLTTFEIENRMLQKSGAWLWTIGRGKIAVRDANGQPIRMTGTVRDISSYRNATDKLRQNQRLLQSIIDHSPAIIYVRDMEYRFMLINRNHAAMFHMTPEEMMGKSDYDLFQPDIVEVSRRSDRLVLEHEQTITAEEIILQEGKQHIYITIKFPLYDENGTLYAIGEVSNDVTVSRQAVEERATMQERIIDAQRSALRELSTPLIPIADGVVIMPLIGSIDAMRAQQMLETLLVGVSAYSATRVILDITGVVVVDTYVASVLVQATQAVKLLGAQVIVTGMRPEIAQTIVRMGQDLGDLITFGTLQTGIASTLQGQSMKRR